eukprot:COSAG05_NODE_17604_length_322_cov_1.385650_1_plen_31_part_10
MELSIDALRQFASEEGVYVLLGLCRRNPYNS